VTLVDRQAADPPADTPGGVDLGFRADIEGLRAVAIILVVLYHCGVTWLTGGYVGVDVFFVVSGFLITGLLIREHEERGTVSIPGFYARRSRRILPAAMVVIIATVIGAHQIQNFITYAQTAVDARWAALFAANFHFAIQGTNYFDASFAPSPLLHYWSLAVEEQFYVVWPAVVLLAGLALRRWPLRRAVLVAAAIICVASFVWALLEAKTDPTWAFFSPLTRAWELGLGALAATLVTLASRIPKPAGIALAWGGLAAILVSALVYSDTVTSYPGAVLLLTPVLGTVAVIVGGCSGTGAVHLLGLRPVRSVGRVSYGWYLLHYPPMILAAGILWTGPVSVHERLAIAAATLAVAYVMYALLEKPIRRSRTLAQRPWASIAMGLGFVAAAFLVALLLHKSI
jgi:peptidoglycan/LPS O-acetylase OafA/YrhL